MHEGKSELYSAKSRIQSSARELAKFRSLHNLKYRDPNFPKNKLPYWAFLFFMFAFESAINGIFLAEGSSFGLVGGVAEAIGFALINVFLPALLFSKLVRYLFHKSWLYKIIGLVSAVTFVILVLSLNGMLAHYRIAQEALVDNAHQVALEAFKANILSFNDTKSIMFFLMGLSFGILALLDGLAMDDRYPGYGPVFRRKEEAGYEYFTLMQDQIGDLQDIRNEAISDVKDAEERANDRMSRFHDLLDRRRNVHVEYPAYMGNLVDTI